MEGYAMGTSCRFPTVRLGGVLIRPEGYTCMGKRVAKRIFQELPAK